jgi:ribosomal protein L29
LHSKLRILEQKQKELQIQHECQTDSLKYKINILREKLAAERVSSAVKLFELEHKFRTNNNSVMILTSWKDARATESSEARATETLRNASEYSTNKEIAELKRQLDMKNRLIRDLSLNQ